MVGKWIKSRLPDKEKLKQEKTLKILGPILFNPLLWHLHRRNVAKAVAIGLFVCVLPIPLQTLLAALFAIIFSANVPIAVVLVWVSNPFTMAPLLLLFYKVGSWVLGVPDRIQGFEISFQWVKAELHVIWKPLLVGCFLSGIVFAIFGYFSTLLFWRCWIVSRWNRRAKRQQS